MKYVVLITLVSLCQRIWATKEQVDRRLGDKKGGNKKKTNNERVTLTNDYRKKDIHHKPIKETKSLATTTRMSALDPNDVGLRYSKIFFKGDPPPGTELPMTPSSYPVTLETASWLRLSMCPSVIIEEDCFKCTIPFETLIEAAGGPPIHPSSDTSSPFWDDFREVVQVQEKRLANVPASTIMSLPFIWKDFNLTQIADAVHNKVLGTYHIEMITKLLAAGAKVDQEIIPFACAVEFIRGIVMLSFLNTWTVATVAPLNFGIKYYVGRARPEEVAYSIQTGAITAPKDIVDAIAERNLSAAVNFTAYPEGSPQHPSWPAMHSAASSASLWLAVVMNLTDDQYCEVKRLDYAISYARTVSGVHFPTDNIAGLNIGQEIIARKLPGELKRMYGSNKSMVKEKIKTLRFDWNDFKSSDCFMDGITIA